MDWRIAFKQSRSWMLLFSLFLMIVFMISLTTGVLPVTLMDAFHTFSGQGTAQQELILYELRLPRMIIAMLIGAGLAVSGAVLQGLSRNSLADPGILGINAGAGLAVVAFIFFFQSANWGESPFILPLFAFTGAVTVALLIYLFSWKNGVTPTRLLLTGIGFNALCGALLMVLQLKMDPRDFQEATIWLTGSLWGTQWRYVLALVPWMIVLIPAVFIQAKSLNIMQLSDPLPGVLGLHTERKRRTLLVLSAALAGACVAVGGGISFLGLLAPHLARKLTGPNFYSLIPVSALIGAFLLLTADLIGKNLLAPADIPVGIVISVIGAPYLIYMLLTRTSQGLKT
ncbi:FecCD family ABC transporter permease [Jeotgalibacillus aurantiacus]|uniref:FecCD family ABC transporter permease n=1 Tax=Jeotgalibacillus aurantiacus TaxID=2763266 RepID=UPI001D0A8155|nr:iron ABC transporter permease [Jeotgalibacillus aurantiacus]